MHYQRWRKHGDPLTVKVSSTTLKPGQPKSPNWYTLSGAQHGNWAGNECTYGSAHDRVKRLHGSATNHQCVDCSQTAAQWSYAGGDPNERTEERRFPRGRTLTVAYSPDPTFYVARCRACHTLHDRGV